MPTLTINKTMDRQDLLTEQGSRFVAELDRLVRTLEEKRLPVTSWYGGLPQRGLSKRSLKSFASKLLGRYDPVGAVANVNRGGEAYESLPGVSNDDRHPWFLFWEAYWAMSRGPSLRAEDRVLDAGGTASLFSSYLASLGCEVESVDLNPDLVEAGNEIATAMGWRMRSRCMDMTQLRYDDDTFDHAYSICVFEHLDHELRQKALREIARVLRPGGTLSITFDYRGPGVHLSGRGPNFDPENLIRTPEDVHRHFFSTGCLEPVGNVPFEDNGESYLVWPDDVGKGYTFGAIFLRKPS